MGRKAVVKSSIKFGLGLVVVLMFVSCATRLQVIPAAAAVPEPSAFVMLLSGLTLVALKYGKY